jgi:hypothetical protein
MQRVLFWLAVCLTASCGQGPVDPRGPERGGPPQLPYDPDVLWIGRKPSGAEGDGLLPRIAIGGHTGLRVTTRVQFLSDPFVPHESSYTFVFPDRALWRLENSSAPESTRVQAYRHGTRLHWLPPASATSVELDGADRGIVLRRFELRRAFALYPEGFPWTGERERTAELFDGSDPLGVLVARTTSLGELESIEVRDVDGSSRERLDRLDPDESGRPRFRVFEAETAVAVETMLDLDPRAELPDWRFLPPDKRSGSGSAPSARVLQGESLSLQGEALHPAGPLSLRERPAVAPETATFEELLASARGQDLHLWIRPFEGARAVPVETGPTDSANASGETEQGPGSERRWPAHWILSRERQDPRAAPTGTELSALRAVLPSGAVELGLLIDAGAPGRLELHFRLPPDHALERSRSRE